MQFDIVTIFPEMFMAMESGVIGRAHNSGLISSRYWNPRDYADNNHRKVDDTSYGGGPGMVMMAKPLLAAIREARSAADSKALLVYLTPQGSQLNDNIVVSLAKSERLILVAGRYEGIDERVMEIEPGIEISIGDYVLSGGELAAMVLMDAVARQIPGVVGDMESVQQDSFGNGLLDYPHYTKPDTVEGRKVPKVLVNGNHAEINRWRRQQALGRTLRRRPDILDKIELTAEDRMLLNALLESCAIEDRKKGW